MKLNDFSIQLVKYWTWEIDLKSSLSMELSYFQKRQSLDYAFEINGKKNRFLCICPKLSFAFEWSEATA